MPAPPAGAGRGGGQGGYIPYPEGVEAPEDRYASGYGMMATSVKPPYSKIIAYDLNKGTIKWQSTAGDGDDPKTAAFGVHNTGYQYGGKSGMLVTATGLLFVAGSDGYVRALNTDTGELMWTGEITPGACCNGGGVHAVPAMYSVNGRQYLVMGANGVGGAAGRGPAVAVDPNDKRPKGIVVFALPAGVN